MSEDTVLPDPVSLSRRGTHNWSESTEVPSSSEQWNLSPFTWLQWNRMVLLTVSLCQVHASIVHRWLLWQRSSPRAATASDSSKRRGRVIVFLSFLSIHPVIHSSKSSNLFVLRGYQTQSWTPSVRFGYTSVSAKLRCCGAWCRRQWQKLRRQHLQSQWPEWSCTCHLEGEGSQINFVVPMIPLFLS